MCADRRLKLAIVQQAQFAIEIHPGMDSGLNDRPNIVLHAHSHASFSCRHTLELLRRIWCAFVVRWLFAWSRESSIAAQN